MDFYFLPCLIAIYGYFTFLMDGILNSRNQVFFNLYLPKPLLSTQMNGWMNEWGIPKFLKLPFHSATLPEHFPLLIFILRVLGWTQLFCSLRFSVLSLANIQTWILVCSFLSEPAIRKCSLPDTQYAFYSIFYTLGVKIHLCILGLALWIPSYGREPWGMERGWWMDVLSPLDRLQRDSLQPHNSFLLLLLKSGKNCPWA